MSVIDEVKAWFSIKGEQRLKTAPLATPTGKRFDESSALINFTGELQTPEKDVNATGAPQWRITREATAGSETITERANQGKYDQIWDNRVNLFGAPPFVNSLAVILDGVDDHLLAPNVSAHDFDRLDPFTLAFWRKGTSRNGFFMAKRVGNTGYRFYEDANKLRFEFRSGGVGDSIRTSHNVNTDALGDGDYHLYTLSYDGSGNASGVNMYIDDTLITKSIDTDALAGSTLNNGALGMGADSNGTNDSAGIFDEFAIWNSALSPAEVLAIYNNGAAIDLQSAKGDYGSQASVVGWWRFTLQDKADFPIVTDQAGNSDATAINYPVGSYVSEVPAA